MKRPSPFYRGEMILGNPYDINNLREFLLYVYASKTEETASPTMIGLASISGCTYCGKVGHKEEECWNKHPKNGKFRHNEKSLPPQPRECWECGKVGYVRRDCPKRSRKNPHISAGTMKNVINEIDICSYIDSASTIHLVNSIDLLTDVMEIITKETVQTVGGELIKLTHKGNRILGMRHGTLQLSEVYYVRKGGKVYPCKCP